MPSEFWDHIALCTPTWRSQADLEAGEEDLEQPAAHLVNPRVCLEPLQRPLSERHLPHPRRLELQRLLHLAQPRSRTLSTLLRGAHRPLAEQMVHCGLKERYLEQEAGHWVRLVAKHVRLPARKSCLP